MCIIFTLNIPFKSICDQASGGMSGIAALAAAAAATQKIPGPAASASATTTPASGIKVVTTTIVTPGGMKVTPVAGKLPGKREQF